MAEHKQEEDVVKVLGTWSSPYTMRARIALNIKSVNYQFLVEKMRPKSQLLLESNPVYKKVPVFFHHGKPIPETTVIIQYIDEVWSSGPSILPSDPYDRAIQRFWTAYIDDKWWPVLYEASMAQGEEAKVSRQCTIEKVKEGLALIEDAFGNCSKGKPFFSGDKIGYLDISFGCFLGWLRATEKLNKNVQLIEEGTTPGLYAWAHRFCVDDAVNALMPQTDKLVEFVKFLASATK